MTRIFSSLLLACFALFAAAAGTAVRGGDAHALLGLLAALFAVLCHSVMFIYLIGTGKTVKLAVETRRLDPSFVEEGKRLLAQAIVPGSFGSLTATAAAVIAGFAEPFVRRVLHPSLAILAIGVNAWAFVRELRTIAANRERLGRAATLLAPRAGAASESAPVSPGALSNALVLVGLSALGTYPYLRFVAREPDVSPLPFVAIGTAGLLAGLLTRRKARLVP